jgi:hypothetical protein
MDNQLFWFAFLARAFPQAGAKGKGGVQAGFLVAFTGML